MTGGGDAADAEGAAPDSEDERWLTRGVGGIGAASLLADIGHEVCAQSAQELRQEHRNTLNVDGGVPAAYTR